MDKNCLNCDHWINPIYWKHPKKKHRIQHPSSIGQCNELSKMYEEEILTRRYSKPNCQFFEPKRPETQQFLEKLDKAEAKAKDMKFTVGGKGCSCRPMTDDVPFIKHPEYK